jgi:predicted ATPase/DNA-binding SARP family transcriptional activator
VYGDGPHGHLLLSPAAKAAVVAPILPGRAYRFFTDPAIVPLVRFGVLGPLAAWTDDDRPVAIRGRKVRAVLADLLAHDGGPVPADRLIDDLWGAGRLPGDPAAALSAKVSQLRRALEDAEAGGRGLLASGPAGYRLRVEDRLDGRRFQALAARARELRDPEARAAGFAAALALWRGPALADVADEPFARPAVARLEELRLAALEDHAEARLALGEHGVLAAELGDLLAAHPLRERLRAAHMRALYRAGRLGEALESYERLRAELAGQVGAEPGAEVCALRRSILRRDPVLDPPVRRAPVGAAPVVNARRRTNLPAPGTGLVGRDGAVAELASRLPAERLLTLTGPGGVGKSRLAVETARRLVDAFPDGVWLVELVAVERCAGPEAADALAEAVTRALELGEPAGGPVAPARRLAEALPSRRLLLVLDNCDHLLEPLAELTATLLGTAPELRVLATSREPLRLAAEVVWSVPPLEVPPSGTPADPSLLARSGAVRLFAERAAAAAPGFRLDAETAGPVAELCRRLDGIPLALELAATRVRALGVQSLVARLDDRLRLLAAGHRGAPSRHRTLAATIDWSWDLLSEPQRAVLRRLAVHAGGCSLEAAEAVCAGDGLSAEEVLELLAGLVDRSLVVMTERSPDGPRYRLLETIAAYCRERMEEACEHERVRRRHRRYYARLAERAEPHLYDGDQARWLRLLDAEDANLRAALDGAVAGGDAEVALGMANALAWYRLLRGRLTVARRSLEAALALGGGSETQRARAAAWRAGIARLQGDDARWADQQQAALRMLERIGDGAGRARAQWFLAYAGSGAGDLAAGAGLVDRAVDGFQAAGDRWGLAAALLLRAKHAHASAAPALLEREGERAARLFRQLGDRWGQLQAGEWLGGLAELTGDYQRADRVLRGGLWMAEELRLWPEVAMRLAWLSWVAMMRRAYPLARERGQRAARLAAEQGHRAAVELAAIGLGFTAWREGSLDAAEGYLRPLLEEAPRGPGAVPPLHLPLVQVGLGHVADRRGDAAGAVALHRDALADALRIEGPRDVALSLEGLAGALTLGGHHLDAAGMLRTAASVRRSSGLAPGPAEREDIERAVARLPAGLAGSEADGGRTPSPAECLRRAAAITGNGAGA